MNENEVSPDTRSIQLNNSTQKQSNMLKYFPTDKNTFL